MSRPLYIYRLAVEIPDHLRWPHEPDNWPEVYERHGWDATPDPHPDAWSNGFQWPDHSRRYHSKQAADKRAAFLTTGPVRAMDDGRADAVLIARWGWEAQR